MGTRGNPEKTAQTAALSPYDQPRFPQGSVVATPRAFAALARRGLTEQCFLRRNVAGDWGDLGNEDRAANERSLEVETRLYSSFNLGGSDTL